MAERLQIRIEVDDHGTPQLRVLAGTLDQVGAASGRTRRQFANVERDLRGLGAGFSRLQASIVTVNQAWALAARVLGTLERAFGATIGAAIGEADRLIGLSRAFDLPIEALGELDFAAKRADVSLEAVLTNVRRFATTVQSAIRDPTGAAARTLGALGDEFKDFQALQADLVGGLFRVATAVDQIGDQGTRAAVGVQLFGRSFGSVLQVVREGSFEELSARGRELGRVMSTELTTSLEGVGDALTELGAAFEGVGLALIGKLDLKGLTAQLVAFAGAINAGRLALANLPTPITDLVRAIGDLGVAYGKFLELLGQLVGAQIIAEATSQFGALSLGMRLMSNIVDGLAISYGALAIALGNVVRLAAIARGDLAGIFQSTNSINDAAAVVESAGRRQLGFLGVRPQAAPPGSAADATAANDALRRQQLEALGVPIPGVPRARTAGTFGGLGAVDKQADERKQFLADLARETQLAQRELSEIDAGFQAIIARGLELGVPIEQITRMAGALRDAKQAAANFELAQGLREDLEGAAGASDAVLARQFALAQQLGQVKLAAEDAGLALTTGLDDLAGVAPRVAQQVDAIRAVFAALGQSAPETIGALVTQMEALRNAAGFVAPLQEMRRTLEDIAVAGSPVAESQLRIRRAVEEIGVAAREAGLAQTASLDDVARALPALGAEIAKIRDLYAQLGQAAPATLEELAARTEELRAVSDQAARGTAAGWFDVFAEIERGSSDVFEALILGTRDIADAFDGLKIAIVRSLVEAFVAGFKEKLGFEGKLKINLVGLVKDIGGIFAGQGAAGGGLLDQFGGALQRNVLGGLGGAGGLFGGSAGAGFTPLVNSFGETVALTTPTGATVTSTGFTAGAGGAAGGQAGALGGLTGAQFLAGVGALVALGFTIKDFVGTLSDQKDVTAGQAGPRRSLALSSGLTLGVGIGGGALAGAAIGAAAGSAVPVLGTIVGALVGAAVGAAIAQAVNSAVTGAIGTGVNKATSKGLTQDQLEEDVHGATGIRVIQGVLSGGVSEFVNTRGTGGRIGLGILTGGLSEVIGAIVQGGIPDIEEIFDDLFTDLLENTLGRPFNDKLEGFFGEGLNRKQRGHLETLFFGDSSAEALQRDARDTIAIIGGLIGAGTDNFERLDRFFRIFANNMAQTKSSVEEVQNALGRLVRDLSGGDLREAVLLVEGLFKGEGGGTGVSPRLLRQRELVVRSFEQTGLFAGADTAAIAQDIRLRPGPTLPGDVKPSRELIRKEALPALLTAEDASTGLRGFFDALREGIAGAVSSGFARAFGKLANLDRLLAPLFRELRRAETSGRFDRLLERLEPVGNDLARRLERATPVLVNMQRITQEATRAVTRTFAVEEVRRGVAEGDVPLVASAVQDLDTVGGPLAARDFDALVGDLRAVFGPELFRALRELGAGGNAVATSVLIAAGQFVDAAEALIASPDLAPLIESLQRFTDGITALRTRVEAAADRVAVGPLAEPPGIDSARRRADRAGERLITPDRTFDQAFTGLDRVFAKFQGFDQLALPALSVARFVELLGRGPQSTDFLRRQAGGGAPPTVDEREGFAVEQFAKGEPERALALLTEYADARLSLLESELSFAEQQRDVFRQMREAFQGLRDSVAILRRGPQAQGDIIRRERARVEELLPAAREGDPEALREIAARLGDILSRGQATFAPGSAAFGDLTTFVDTIATELGASLEDALPGLDTQIADLTDEITAFVAQITRAVDALEAIGGTTLTDAIEARLDAIKDALTGDANSIKAVLEEIRNRLPLPARAHGGPVARGIPTLVGERGPELFVPRTAGLVASAPVTRALALAAPAGALAGGTTRRGAREALAGVLARADGGPVPGGRPVLVGERGPEAMIQRAAGGPVLGGQRVLVGERGPELLRRNSDRMSGLTARQPGHLEQPTRTFPSPAARTLGRTSERPIGRRDVPALAGFAGFSGTRARDTRPGQAEPPRGVRAIQAEIAARQGAIGRPTLGISRGGRGAAVGDAPQGLRRRRSQLTPLAILPATVAPDLRGPRGARAATAPAAIARALAAPARPIRGTQLVGLRGPELIVPERVGVVLPADMTRRLLRTPSPRLPRPLGADDPMAMPAVPRRAVGGPVLGGQRVLVGERGAEAFTTTTTTAPRGAAPIHVAVTVGPIHIHGVSDPEAAAKAVERAIRQRTLPALVDEIRRAAR